MAESDASSCRSIYDCMPRSKVIRARSTVPSISSLDDSTVSSNREMIFNSDCSIVAVMGAPRAAAAVTILSCLNSC